RSSRIRTISTGAPSREPVSGKARKRIRGDGFPSPLFLCLEDKAMHVLVTRRLTLRPPALLDAEDIALWLSNWKVARMLARVPFPYQRKDAEEWIASLAEKPAAHLVYTIHRERLIGVVSIEGGGDEPVLGYWLAEPWHGKGFMTEAAAALLAHAFGTRGIEA